jgi:hypothetical protein
VQGLLLGKATDPLTSCEVEAMVELITARLAELVSARLSDGRHCRCVTTEKEGLERLPKSRLKARSRK